VRERRYLEDLKVGERRLSSVFTLTEEEAIEFALRYDPQLMHVDREVSARGPFGGLIASGWHTAALMMRMMAEIDFFGGETLGLGVDAIRWPLPVRPGDSLQTEMEVESVRASKSNPAFGVVKLRVIVRNQRDEVVLMASPNCWVPRRDGATPQSGPMPDR
jgi:acyl dehydratase